MIKLKKYVCVVLLIVFILLPSSAFCRIEPDKEKISPAVTIIVVITFLVGTMILAALYKMELDGREKVVMYIILVIIVVAAIICEIVFLPAFLTKMLTV